MTQNKQPVYKEVENYITDKIISGSFPLNTLLPSERKIQEELNVSRVTVRRAFEELVAKGIITKSDKKRSMIARVPVLSKRNLAFASPMSRKHILDIYRMFFDSLFMLSAQKGENLYYIDIASPIPDIYKRMHFDTIFLAGHQDACMEELLSSSTKVISLDDLAGNPVDLCVCTDNYDGGKKAAEILLNSGKMMPAFICVKGSLDLYRPNVLRLNGFQEQLVDAGIEFCDSNIIEIEPALDLNSTLQVLKNYLMNNEMDSIFAVNDVIAVMTLKSLQKIGCRIAEDISLVGFDGLEFGLYTTPSLTSVVQPVFEISNVAYQKSLLSKDELTAENKIKLPTSIIYRDSI